MSDDGHDRDQDRQETPGNPGASGGAGGSSVAPFEAIRHTDEATGGEYWSASSRARHYVYTLAYPDGHVFYIGKGTGNRIDEHERNARRGVQSLKCDIIRAIWAQGGEVIKTKRAFFATAEEALAAERRLIAAGDGLANIAPGEKSLQRVVISAEDQRLFGASIRRFDAHGEEYWSAREMAGFLGYRDWASFSRVVSKIERAQSKAGQDVAAHFRHTVLLAEIGSGACRPLDDVHLSRIGFLLVLQNADNNKAIVAYGKTYIASQTARIARPLVSEGIGVIAHSHRLKLRPFIVGEGGLKDGEQ